MKNKLNSKHLNIQAFSATLDLILNNNVFKSGNILYKQIIWIAMGSKCGPSIANIYLSLLEDKWLQIHKPLFYEIYR